MLRNPSATGKHSGWIAAASACSPRTSVGAGVFRYSSRMQKTRPLTAAGSFSQPRVAMIFSSGTRSPAPHQAAISTSGAAAVTSSREICAPGVPTNSPPAASTSSATHGCDAISGLPHSSQNMRGRGSELVCNRRASMSFLICWITCSPASRTSMTLEIIAMSA